MAEIAIIVVCVLVVLGLLAMIYVSVRDPDMTSRADDAR